MTRHVEAVYEHGVLRPLEPLSLSESQRVKLTITDAASGRTFLDVSLTERARAEAAVLHQAPTLDEVRAALAAIPGSLSNDVIHERGDY
jgi:predicted DNA-binding antitoxin AbrB/MazE fold protein